MAKVRGKGNGVRANTDDGIGVRGEGVVGQANFGAGVPPDRITDQGIAVTGLANTGIDVAGMSTSGAGVFGLSQTGLAGHFKGSVLVADDFTVGQQERRSASPGRYSPAALLHGEPGELVRRFWGKDV